MRNGQVLRLRGFFLTETVRNTAYSYKLRNYQNKISQIVIIEITYYFAYISIGGNLFL